MMKSETLYLCSTTFWGGLRESWASSLETFLKFNLHFRCPSAPSRLGVPFHSSNFGPAGVGRKIQPPRWRAETLRNFSSSTGNIRLSLTLILSLSCIRSWRLNLVNCELRVFFIYLLIVPFKVEVKACLVWFRLMFGDNWLSQIRSLGFWLSLIPTTSVLLLLLSLHFVV